MVTYKILEERKDNQTQITLYKIESMRKIIKYHQSELDFEKYFIMREVSVADFDNAEEVDMTGKNKKNGIKQKSNK